MRRWTLLLVAVALTSCAKASVATSIVNPAYRGSAPSRVVSVFLYLNQQVRQAAETALYEADQRFTPSFLTVPDLEAESAVIVAGVDEAGAEAVLYVIPSNETIGGERTPDTTSEVCTQYDVNLRCVSSFRISGGGNTTNVLWAGFSAQLIDRATGDVIWSATIQSDIPQGASRPSLAELASLATIAAGAEAVADGVISGR